MPGSVIREVLRVTKTGDSCRKWKTDEMRVVVLDDYQGVAASCADWSGLDCDVTFIQRHIDSAADVVTTLDEVEVVVAMRERTRFDASVLDRLPSLRLLVTTGMRNASIDLAAAARNEITVCGTRSPGHATAELAFAFIQLLARGLTTEISSVETGGWQVGLGRDLRGATLGVIGLGRLGSQVAQLGQAFGMDVLAWSENLDAARAEDLGVRAVSHNELFENADFISVHLRLSERTRGLIGADEFAAMKSDAFLINTSRGAIVDQDALLSAVRSGSIGGAGIDVFDQEPLGPDHPFRRESRILATPHIGYVTRETYDVFYGDVVENIAAWIAGSPIRVLG
jgi:phosphoglycerate dehydrogenase-like enzyme